MTRSIPVLVLLALGCVGVPLRANAEQGFAIRVAELREGPAFSRIVLVRLPVGQPLEILGETTGWIHVRAAGRDGWMRSHVVGRPSRGASVPQGAPLSASATEDAGSRTSEAPRVQATQTFTSAPVASAGGYDGGYDAESGSPASRAAVESTDVSAPAAALPAAAHAGGRTLYLREFPSWQTPLSGHVPPGERVETIASEEDWTQVRCASGRVGWVRTEALDRRDASAASLPAPELQIAASAR